jgi:uncharacterized protein
MIKWLLVIGVVSFVYFYFIKKKPIQTQTQKNTKSTDDTLEADEMVECVVCGTYCEIDDMILSGSKYYCSQECLEKR